MTGRSVQDDGMAPPTLADMIKRLRGQMNQQSFADTVGISGSMIGHVEAGTRSLGVESIEKIIRALNLDADQAVALRAARDRMSKAKQPSLPAQIAKVERTLGLQLDRMEESITLLVEVLVEADRLGSLQRDVDDLRVLLERTQDQLERTLQLPDSASGEVAGAGH